METRPQGKSQAGRAAADLTGTHRGQQPRSAHLAGTHASPVLEVTFLIGDDAQRGHLQDWVVPYAHSEGRGK